jgi:hypothetical protein
MIMKTFTIIVLTSLMVINVWAEVKEYSGTEVSLSFSLNIGF